MSLLSRPRRSSRANTQEATTTTKPYEPVFQPPGYAYKIALPSRPQPGQTPWPAHLPPVVSAPATKVAFGNVTNVNVKAQQQKSAYAQAEKEHVHQQPAYATLGRSGSHRPSVPSVASTTRSRAMTMPSAPQPPPLATDLPPSQWPHGLNPLLAAGPLLWHLKLPPTFIKIRLTHLSTPGPLTYTHRSLPTSSTSPLASLILPLPGQAIRISVNGTTLGEMLDALYEALRLPASGREWECAGEQGQKRAARAYRARCGTDAGELKRGVRRVDLLGEGAAFAGLNRAQNGEWVLRVVSN
ncbi:hypothetical protein EXIGLDRAFT_697527 [Exidia glandulosa HHB12029]|uniref:DUF6699 domain-containing protein n=1 Tax=Exidia glandulosa HHB12029 TaxID=1314781 RepID=A0A165EQF1_EXIGL|nr:hypothetical protein EXIGLDRAFT_697527 [Exidia glandulosa HHB12029]